MKLTGRRRHRMAFQFLAPHVIVLQVEEQGMVSYNVGGLIDSEMVTRWRDARLEDLSTEERSL